MLRPHPPPRTADGHGGGVEGQVIHLTDADTPPPGPAALGHRRICRPVVEFGRLRRRVPRNLLGVFQAPPVQQIRRDPVARNVWQRVEGGKPRRCATLDHRQDHPRRQTGGRPEWTVTRGSTPAAQGRSGEPQPHHLRRERHDLVLRRQARGGPERPEGAGDAALHEPHDPRLALPGSSCCGGR